MTDLFFKYTIPVRDKSESQGGRKYPGRHKSNGAI